MPAHRVRRRKGVDLILTASSAIPAETAIDDILANHAGQPGALLPILHEIQHRFGHVAPDFVPVIAGALNLSRADVHGVIHFYPHFRSKPAGRHVVQVCRAEACQAVQGERTEAHAKARLGVDFGGTTLDGRFSLEPVFCLGNCAAGPSVMIDDAIYGRVTPDRLDELLEDWRGRS
jgi:formate dehydrogenase subunit gamma